jgi:hypothetical protein
VRLTSLRNYLNIKDLFTGFSTHIPQFKLFNKYFRITTHNIKTPAAAAAAAEFKVKSPLLNIGIIY